MVLLIFLVGCSSKDNSTTNNSQNTSNVTESNKSEESNKNKEDSTKNVEVSKFYTERNGVKLEVYKNNIVQYYTYSSRGHSLLHYQFGLQDIEQITIKKRPFSCVKLSIKIRNPIFLEGHEKKLNKLVSVSIITDKLKADAFMHEMKQFQSDKSDNQVS